METLCQDLRVRIKPVKTVEKDSEGSLFQAEGRVGIEPHSGVAELGAWPVVQQDWAALYVAWGGGTSALPTRSVLNQALAQGSSMYPAKCSFL